MFKCASTSQFQNTPFNSSSYLKDSSFLFDCESPSQLRTKKTKVKFQIENDKENSKFKEDHLENESFTRKDKYNKTWTHQLIPLEQDDDAVKKALQQLKTTKFNCDKTIKTNQLESSSKNIPKPYDTDGFGYSSKKYSDSKKFIQEPTKFERSYKKCKSLKTLRCYSPEEDEQIPTIRVKKQRNFQKVQAFNQLLKSSEDLILKYKKLEQQKTKLKSELKTQIQSHSKSSKKITFMQEDQAYKSKKSKDQRTQQQPTVSSFYTPYKSKSPKMGDYCINLAKYDKFDSKYDTKKFDLGLTKSSYGASAMNKTFNTSSKSYLTQRTSPVKYQSSTTYSGSFGLDKSSYSKKLSPTGLSLADFQLGSCLGSGAFGEVFPARHRKSNWLFAMKKVKKQKVKYMLDQFIQEIKIQLFLDHPNIVKLYSFFDDELHFYIIMQYMQGGSLFSHLKKQKTLSLQETSQKLKEVCEGLNHMHDNSILHRDIKPQNVVLSHNVAKLCDFGWSAICKDRRTTYCGTLDYVCPEIIGGDGYDDSVDIWCIGVLAYELIVGKTPFYNISRKETMKKILDCNLEYPTSMPEVAASFVKRILRKNPDQRQTIQQVLRDPLLKFAPKRPDLL